MVSMISSPFIKLHDWSETSHVNNFGVYTICIQKQTFLLTKNKNKDWLENNHQYMEMLIIIIMPTHFRVFIFFYFLLIYLLIDFVDLLPSFEKLKLIAYLLDWVLISYWRWSLRFFFGSHYNYCSQYSSWKRSNLISSRSWQKLVVFEISWKPIDVMKVIVLWNWLNTCIYTHYFIDYYKL